MNIRTRHLGILAYSGLAALIIAKDIISDPIHIVGLLAPIVAMVAADKGEAIVRKLSGKDPK